MPRSKASGNKCSREVPNSTPVDKLTMGSSDFAMLREVSQAAAKMAKAVPMADANRTRGKVECTIERVRS